MNIRLGWAGLFVLGLTWLPVSAQEDFTLSVTSSVSHVNLVELYSSEGCSSCLPAEAWLTSLKQHDGLWRDIIPVAFHVDYWNDLGWKDRFASPVFTHRQRKYRDVWDGRYIYTPAVVVNGNEWPDWRTPNAIIPLETNSVGRLSLDYRDNTVNMEFRPEHAFAKAYDAYFALIGMGVESAVSAGENSGQQLTHDFIVLQYAQRRVKQRDGVYYDRMELNAALPADVQSRALVVWLTKNRSMLPLQAVGGILIPESSE